MWPWWEAGGLMLSLVIGLMALGAPVAFAFLITNIVGAYVFMGGFIGIEQLVGNTTEAVSTFILVAIPMFILMGNVFFHSGVAVNVIETLDRCFGKSRGRLAYIAVTSGTIFAALSGSNLANTAMMGSLLGPEMERRGYSRALTIGPVIGSGGLAILIPPSALAVLLGSLAEINIGALLLAGLLPGVTLAALYAGLIWMQLRWHPEAAPPYDVAPASLREKLRLIAQYILPMSLVVFCVVGLILLGIATPSESAAFGVLAVLVLAAAYRRLDLEVIRKSLIASLKVTTMVFFIILASKTFSQVLAFSGATSGFIRFATGFELGALEMLLLMFLVLLILGMFVDAVSIMLLTIPIFFPIAEAVGIDVIWFGLVMLLAIEMSGTTPPFGLLLFVMLGVAPKGTRYMDVVRAAAPYLLCDAILLALLILLPGLALWLPSTAY